IHVQAGVQQHLDLAGLPEARPAVVARHLQLEVDRRRAQRLLANGHRQINNACHASETSSPRSSRFSLPSPCWMSVRATLSTKRGLIYPSAPVITALPS